jgi:DNA-directed RNA polymerase sigma subunit (sigma70/sigma32)
MISISRIYSKMGTEPLMDFAARYDYTRGFKFSTLGRKRVYWGILREINKPGVGRATGRAPSRPKGAPTPDGWEKKKLHQKLADVESARARLRQRHRRNPTLLELADEVGIHLKELEPLELMSQGLVRLDALISNGDDNGESETLLDQLAAGAAEDPTMPLPSCDSPDLFFSKSSKRIYGNPTYRTVARRWLARTNLGYLSFAAHLGTRGVIPCK